MQETIYDPKTGLHYKLVGDYYIPLVKAPEPPNIGIWGHRRLDYLKTYRRLLYNSVWLANTLNTHLVETDRQATALYDRLITQFATIEGITVDLDYNQNQHFSAIHDNLLDEHSRL